MADEQTTGQDPRAGLTGAGAAIGQRPSKGRIVIYRDGNGDEHAAIVTRVYETGAVGLHVFRDDAFAGPIAAQQQIDPADETAIGWFWPPRV